MIDLDINANVTALEYGCGDWEFNGVEFYHCGIDGSGYFSQPVIDYCNNPSCTWPIMMENKISIEYDKSDDHWVAHQGDYIMGKFVTDCGYRYQYTDKNPLRAAMIVYLKMNDKD